MLEHQIFGERFQLISELSSGGFGQTFLAEDSRSLNKLKCVVKQLKPQSDDPQIIDLSKRLFEQEVRILYQVGEHPQIPSIITHFEEDNEFYFVQEYIEGNTFAQELAQGKIFNQRQVVEIITELLSVLAFVHSRDVIHRDIKPSNLICRKSDGKTVLIDFGAVKQVGKQSSQNSNQTTKGTIAIGSEGYMPMEQIAGHPRFSSDVYAVGMVAIQLLTQTHPTKLRQNQRTGEWIWQDKVSVNNQFAEFINEMIRYDYRQRFTDASEALNYLRRLNLNGGKSQNNHHYPNQTVENNGNGVNTQATFFSPASIQPQFRQENQLFGNNQNFAPQFNRGVQPLDQNLQQYNGQPPSIPNSSPNYSTKPVTQFVHPIQTKSDANLGATSLTLGGSYFDTFRGSVFSRTVFAIGFVAVFGLGIFIYAISNANTDYYQSPLPQLTQPNGERESSAFIKSARKKEGQAKTSEDWILAAQEWKKAEDYYKNIQLSAGSDEERERAAKDKDYCSKAGYYAFEKSRRLKKPSSSDE
jgi:serine/threonine protein kinase